MPSLSEKNVLNIVGSFYDAAQTQTAEGWQHSFELLRSSVASDGGSLSFRLPPANRYQPLIGTYDQSFFDEYNECFQFHSPLRRIIAQLKDREGVGRADVISDAEFLETEFYQEFLRRYDIFNYEYHLLFREGDVSASIGFSRPRRMKNFGAKEKLLLRTLIPHVARSIQIFYKCSDYRQDLEILRASFERMNQGAIVVDDRCRIVMTNTVATGLIERRDGLRTDERNVLETMVPAETKRLRSLIADVVEDRLLTADRNGGFLAVTRPAGRRPLSMFVAPFCETNALFFLRRRLALIFFNDPEGEISDVEPLLRRMYRLTPAETRIAAMIARGYSVKEVCRLLEIKENTIRTHLKRVFSKTETKRQSELVKLVVSNSTRIGNFQNETKM